MFEKPCNGNVNSIEGFKQVIVIWLISNVIDPIPDSVVTVFDACICQVQAAVP